MAQEVINRLYVEKNREREYEVFEAIKDDDIGVGSIDFAKIIPTSENESDVVWGTRVISTTNEVNLDGYRRYIRFETAWSAPCKVIAALSALFPDVLFTHEWSDIAFGENCGREVYKNGVCIDAHYPETMRECYEFGAQVEGINLNQIGYALNSTEDDYINVWMQEYQPVLFNGIYGLFASSSLQPKEVPKGLYVYGLEDVPSEKALAIVKHPAGMTLVLKEPLAFGDSDRVLITSENRIACAKDTANFEQLLLGDFTHKDDYSKRYKLRYT